MKIRLKYAVPVLSYFLQSITFIPGIFLLALATDPDINGTWQERCIMLALSVGLMAITHRTKKEFQEEIEELDKEVRVYFVGNRYADNFWICDDEWSAIDQLRKMGEKDFERTKLYKVLKEALIGDAYRVGSLQVEVRKLKKGDYKSL